MIKAKVCWALSSWLVLTEDFGQHVLHTNYIHCNQFVISGHMSTLQVVAAPKDITYQLRMNSEIKAEVEKIYADCGVTLSDAINIFLQQSLNERGFPFPVVSNQTVARRQRMVEDLLEIHRKGMESGARYGWTSEADMEKEFGGIE